MSRSVQTHVPLSDRDRPRLRHGLPLLRRSDDQLQVGLDPERGVVLGGVPVPADAVLELLDGRHTLAEVRTAAATAGLGADLLDWVLTTLTDAALLDAEAGTGRPATDSPVVRLIGAGALGRAIAVRLLDLSPAALVVSDPADADRYLYPTAQLGDSRAQALARLLTDRTARVGSPTSVQIGLPWHALEATVDVAAPSQVKGRRTARGRTRSKTATTARHEPTPDLTVVASEFAEVDRAITDALLRRDEKHLVVSVRPDAVVVGPLVDPGRSPCLHCLDLGRVALDRAWPRLLAQLTRLPGSTGSLAIDWAAATATQQVAAWIGGGWAETLGTTLELTDPGRRLRRTGWAIQPGCGCAWPSTARWGA